MKRRILIGLALLLVVAYSAQADAAPPRGLMQARYGGDGCGCDAPIVYEPGCGCETSCCEPRCCPRIIPAVVHGAGCLVHGTGRLLKNIFCCNRCYDPCCGVEMEAGCGCESGCTAPAGDCWGCDHGAGYEGHLKPMSASTSKAYRNWNIAPNSVSTARSKSMTTASRTQVRSSENSIVKSKPSTAKKPGKLSTRTASSARPLKADDVESSVQNEVAVVRRTSYNEPSKAKTSTKTSTSKSTAKSKSRVPHNPLRD